MVFGQLVELTGEMPCFDLALVVQAFGDRRESIRVQLSRWMKQGKVVGLRRGMYTLSATYRRRPLHLAELANQLYRPSYLSGLWALGHYDLIPERVVRLTSVTPRVPRRFENTIGVFDYQNIKKDCFFGFRREGIEGQAFWIADPEKAILDHWHLTAGEWSPGRLDEMRYQNVAEVNGKRLQDYAARFGSPRLQRAARRWMEWASCAGEGTITL